MRSDPIIDLGEGQRPSDQPRIAADGQSFGIYEWRGSGPTYLHVHHADDEAWHILEGTVKFRFADREVTAPAGASVFVPAGVPHTYVADESARYLIVLTPRLRDLIAELQQTRDLRLHGDILRRYESEILE